MKFNQRLAFFLFGLLLGIIFVYFVWNGKKASFNYFPNARVLSNLRSKPFHYSDEVIKQFEVYKLDSLDVKKCLNDGDVDFDKSKKDTLGGKKYVVENDVIVIEVINYEDKVVLGKIKKK